MANIEIYTTRTCPFCIRAKALLDKKNVSYTEHDVSGDPEARALMTKRAGGATSVPQIFVNDALLSGGCDGLYMRDANDELDALLK